MRGLGNMLSSQLPPPPAQLYSLYCLQPMWAPELRMMLSLYIVVSDVESRGAREHLSGHCDLPGL
jgi:hypothetical protein